MLFNSWQFLIFFPVVTLLYYVLPHRARWLLLLLASCVFYCALIPIYILILFFTIGVDYVAGIYIEKSTGARRKQFLVMSIVANLGVLAVFKYCNFFINNYNHVLHFFHLGVPELGIWRIILPIGLSFHTFQAMSYTIEVYRGNQKAERHLGIYALYVMFYPQLVAGPIERPQHMMHQFYERHPFVWDNLWRGLRLMLWGLFKKAVVADRLDAYVHAMFTNPDAYHPGNVMLGAVFFAFIAYGDVSGYSDMAIGSARAMGFTLMNNFDRPYMSSNIAMFWRRWHISLSTWFRDYLYIPLGGNRVGPIRRNFNLFFTFLMSGFWHGANWTYIAWGGLHGIYVVIYTNLEILASKLSVGRQASDAIPSRDGIAIVGKVFGTLLTFSLCVIGLVFFRSGSIGEALHFFHYVIAPTSLSFFDLPSIKDVQLGASWYAFVFLLFGFVLVSEEVLVRNENKFTSYALPDSIWLGLVFFLVLTMGVFNQDTFIYFQF
jgi:D-alanyl-lipoteichoic acid acyltransferase DltB (MBOAT superfamily)